MNETKNNNDAAVATQAAIPYSKGKALKKSRANLVAGAKTHNVLAYDVNGLGWTRFAGPYAFAKAYRIARELEAMNHSGKPQYTVEAVA